MKPPQWIGSALIFTGLLGLASLWSAWAALVVAVVWVLFLLPGDDYVDRFEARRDINKETDLPSRHLTCTPDRAARAAAHTGCDVVHAGTGAPEGRSDKHGRPSIIT